MHQTILLYKVFGTVLRKYLKKKHQNFCKTRNNCWGLISAFFFGKVYINKIFSDISLEILSMKIFIDAIYF